VNSYIGVDKNGNKLKVGDRCKFLVKESVVMIPTWKPNEYSLGSVELEGIISYDSEYFAYCFDIDSDYCPCLLMRVAEYGSIERID